MAKIKFREWLGTIQIVKHLTGYRVEEIEWWRQ